MDASLAASMVALWAALTAAMSAASTAQRMVAWKAFRTAVVLALKMVDLWAAK